MNETIIKKGTSEWWTFVAITYVKPAKVGETVTVDVDEIDRWIDSVNRNPFKRLWILLTNGDVTLRDVTEAEEEALLNLLKIEQRSSER